jgi:hypothetical protein
MRVALAGVLLSATRPLSPLWTAAIVAVVLVAAARRRAPAWRDRGARLAVGSVVVAAVGMEVLALVRHSSVAVITSPPGAARSHLWYAQEAARRTFDWLDQLVGVLGWRDVPLWPVVTPLWGLVVAALVVAAWRRGGRRQRAGLALTALAVLIAPVAAEVASGQVVGMAWQGRYVLPIAVGLPLQSAWLLSRSPASDATVGFERRWTPAIAVVLAVCHGAALLRVLDRYAAGLPSGVLVALRTDGGVGPIGWRPMVVVVALVMVAVGTAWLALVSWPPERNSARSRYPRRRRSHGKWWDCWVGS